MGCSCKIIAESNELTFENIARYSTGWAKMAFQELLTMTDIVSLMKSAQTDDARNLIGSAALRSLRNRLGVREGDDRGEHGIDPLGIKKMIQTFEKFPNDQRDRPQLDAFPCSPRNLENSWETVEITLTPSDENLFAIAPNDPKPSAKAIVEKNLKILMAAISDQLVLHVSHIKSGLVRTKQSFRYYIPTCIMMPKDEEGFPVPEWSGTGFVNHPFERLKRFFHEISTCLNLWIEIYHTTHNGQNGDAFVVTPERYYCEPDSSSVDYRKTLPSIQTPDKMNHELFPWLEIKEIQPPSDETTGVPPSILKG